MLRHHEPHGPVGRDIHALSGFRVDGRNPACQPERRAVQRQHHLAALTVVADQHKHAAGLGHHQERRVGPGNPHRTVGLPVVEHPGRRRPVAELIQRSEVPFVGFEHVDRTDLVGQHDAGAR
ncbi:MAG: hypothetical protein ACK55I_47545, partial [bacterium]